MYSKQTPPIHTRADNESNISSHPPPTTCMCYRQQLLVIRQTPHLCSGFKWNKAAIPSVRRMPDSSVKQGWMIPAHRFPLPTKSFSDRRTAWCYHLASVLLPHPTQYTLAWLTRSIVCVCESVTAGNQFILLLLF